MNENVYDCLNDLVKELDRLSKDHPQWKSSPLRERCVSALETSCYCTCEEGMRPSGLILEVCRNCDKPYERG